MRKGRDEEGKGEGEVMVGRNVVLYVDWPLRYMALGRQNLRFKHLRLEQWQLFIMKIIYVYSS